MSCIRLRTARKAGLHNVMGDSFNALIYFPVWPLPQTAIIMGIRCNCLIMSVLLQTLHWMRSIALCGAKVLQPAQIIYNSIASCHRPPKKNKTASWLSGSRRKRHGLQCRCQQPTPIQPMCNIKYRGDRGGMYINQEFSKKWPRQF